MISSRGELDRRKSINFNVNLYPSESFEADEDSNLQQQKLRIILFFLIFVLPEQKQRNFAYLF